MALGAAPVAVGLTFESAAGWKRSSVINVARPNVIRASGPDGRRDYDKLAAAYIGKEVSPHQDRSGSEWARECVHSLEAADPGATLYFILIALDSLSRANAANLSYLAAGPLENILDSF